MSRYLDKIVLFLNYKTVKRLISSPCVHDNCVFCIVFSGIGFDHPHRVSVSQSHTRESTTFRMFFVEFFAPSDPKLPGVRCCFILLYSGFFLQKVLAASSYHANAYHCSSGNYIVQTRGAKRTIVDDIAAFVVRCLLPRTL